MSFTLKWSNGSIGEKSSRKIKEEEQEQPLIIVEENKREDAYAKISERELISQINKNPFMAQNTYLDDISARDLFFKTINTGETKKE
jgi:hypothetical protein